MNVATTCYRRVPLSAPLDVGGGSDGDAVVGEAADRVEHEQRQEQRLRLPEVRQ